MTGGRRGCVRNDREKGCCVRDGRGKRVLRSGWQNGGRVIWSDGRDLRSVDGVGAVSLDSSLCSE